MTRGPRFLLLLLVLFTVSAIADEPRLWMMPVAPTVDTPITFFYSASCESIEEVTRSGSVITLHITDGPCSPPRVDPLVIPLPEKTLPAGEYQVDVVLENGPAPPIVRESLSFVVRPDESDAPIRIRPSTALTIGGALVRLYPQADEAFCPNGECTIRVDGVAVEKSQDPAGGLVFVAPAHAAGFADVSIANVNTTFTAPKALYYFAPGSAPLPSLFERVLFPILFDTPGANGSEWRTETTIANPNPFTVDNYNDVQPLVCATFPCGERLGPRSFVEFNGGEFPHGIALLVPRAEAPLLSFQSRVRDVSLADDTLGSEIPVVRERDMVRGVAASLLDVPLDPRYRAKLRIYRFAEGDSQTAGAEVRIVPHGAQPASTEFVPLHRTCTSCQATPFYAEVDLRSEADLHANIYVRTDRNARALTWAFVSITNNKTQQVTIISADGAGGEPCAGCPRAD
jgi:hypothetical protein